MIQQILQKYSATHKPVDSKSSVAVVSAIVIFIVSLTIFQDFLDSLRRGYSFYFSESILFKTTWFLFIPFLAILYKILRNSRLDSRYKTAFFIIAPVSIHILILPFVVLLFSVLFYDGRYGLYKMFTYTMANDFYQIVLVYATCVLGYNYFSRSATADFSTSKKYPESIVIGNGKDNTIINTQAILQITSATPYVAIQLENKKYLHTATLKSICDQLDPGVFIRVHKSAVVNSKAVVSYRSRLNGDYDLVLTNGQEIRLSRTYAAHFKKMFEASHQLTQ